MITKSLNLNLYQYRSEIVNNNRNDDRFSLLVSLALLWNYHWWKIASCFNWSFLW